MNLVSKLRRVGSVLAASVLALGATEAAQAAPPDPMATPPPPGSPNTIPSKSLPMQLTHFELTCAGAAPISWKTASGLSNEAEVVEHKQADKNGHVIVQKIPGAVKFATISLKSGTGDASLWKWRDMVVKGDLRAKRACELAMVDAEGTQLARYALRAAYPTHLAGAQGENAKSGAVTDMTLAVEGLTRLK